MENEEIFDYVRRLSFEKKCVINLTICPDGQMRIQASGNTTDFVLIDANMDKDVIKCFIEDTVKRATSREEES